VTVPQVVLLTGVALTLLSLGCVLVSMVSAAERAPSGNRVPGRPPGRPDRGDRRALRRLDRKIGLPSTLDRLTDDRRLPPVEQIAAELRRLDRQRRFGPSTESEKWSAAVANAYDAWLLAACRRLDIREDLTTLAGIDRDIERVRVEGQLETAGLVLRSGTNGW
jgi:hypothetical protein